MNREASRIENIEGDYERRTGKYFATSLFLATSHAKYYEFSPAFINELCSQSMLSKPSSFPAFISTVFDVYPVWKMKSFCT